MGEFKNISIIVPALNEEKYIGKLLDSLYSQTYKNFEVIVVDGGSSDKTVQICNEYGAIIKIKTGVGEFGQRNEGVKLAKGEIIINTCADVIFPQGLLEKIEKIFSNGSKYIGLTGPGVPLNPPLWAKIEYIVYNASRYIASKFTIYSISTNFVACKKEVFNEIAFKLKEMNSDGLFGKELSKMGKIRFDMRLSVFISSRRMWNSGFIGFNMHYFYVVENFLNITSRFFDNYKKKKLILHERSHKAN